MIISFLKNFSQELLDAERQKATHWISADMTVARMFCNSLYHFLKYIDINPIHDHLPISFSLEIYLSREFKP